MFTGSHREAFCGGKSLNQLREELIQYLSVSVGGFDLQACSFNHSDISPLLESMGYERPKTIISETVIHLLIF
jgi:hypothetical protein